MPAPVRSLESLHSALTSAFKSADTTAVAQLLSQIKIVLATSQLLFTNNPTSVPQDKALLIRDVFEIGALWSTHTQDIPAFERYMAQLRTYYTDYSHLPPSSRQCMLQGLDLLRLLSQNRISEFHASLELIPDSVQRNDKYVKFACVLEQCLMEGSYHKVWNLKKDCPAQEYVWFLGTLMETIRDEIASCSEKSYESLPLKDAQTLLSLNSLDELMKFSSTRSWVVNTMEDRLYFTPPTNPAEQKKHKVFGITGKDEAGMLGDEEPDMDVGSVIRQTLFYARELEKIV